MDPRFFFSLFMARALRAWVIRRGKKLRRSITYAGPRTRLIRGISCSSNIKDINEEPETDPDGRQPTTKTKTKTTAKTTATTTTTTKWQ